MQQSNPLLATVLRDASLQQVHQKGFEITTSFAPDTILNRHPIHFHVSQHNVRHNALIAKNCCSQESFVRPHALALSVVSRGYKGVSTALSFQNSNNNCTQNIIARTAISISLAISSYGLIFIPIMKSAASFDIPLSSTSSILTKVIPCLSAESSSPIT